MPLMFTRQHMLAPQRLHNSTWQMQGFFVLDLAEGNSGMRHKFHLHDTAKTTSSSIIIRCLFFNCNTRQQAEQTA